LLVPTAEKFDLASNSNPWGRYFEYSRMAGGWFIVNNEFKVMILSHEQSLLTASLVTGAFDEVEWNEETSMRRSSNFTQPHQRDVLQV
jgi:hypothetical protein